MQRVTRYFTWLQEVWCYTNPSTLRNHAQLLSDLLRWESHNSAVNSPQLIATLDKFVIPEVRDFHNKQNRRTIQDRTRIRDQKCLRRKGRLVNCDEFAAVPTAAVATFSALYEKAVVRHERLSPAECELAERCFLLLLPTTWAQQRTSILERMEIGLNIEQAQTEDGEPGAWEYRPGLTRSEKADGVRRGPSDLRVLPFHKDVEHQFAFLCTHVHPVLLAEAKKNERKDSQPAYARLMDLPDEDTEVELEPLPAQYPLWLTHTGKRATDADLRFWYSADFFFHTGMALNPQDVRRNMAAFFYSSDNAAYISEANYMRYLFDHHPIVAWTYYSPRSAKDTPSRDREPSRFLSQFAPRPAASHVAPVHAASDSELAEAEEAGPQQQLRIPANRRQVPSLHPAQPDTNARRAPKRSPRTHVDDGLQIHGQFLH